ncbi:MAG TPA: AAA family ATPase [Verrucomicrobiae bacterium]|nr:AAA family ATPase [Verrucomicrobiae bacterium]
MQFTQAQRRRAKLKLAVTGPPGSGKTMSALRLATGLVGPGGKIAVIDTENRSASLYSDRFRFDVCDIDPPFEVEKFVAAIGAATAASYDCLIIDSASHLWKGVLEFKGSLDSRGGNSFTNWNQAGKKYDAGLAAILQSDIHLIACMRSKVEYVLEEDIKGKQVPRKVGLAPVFRDEGEYEFTIVFDVAHDHTAQVSKDRTGMFTDRIFQVTEDIGKQVGAWLDGGEIPAAEPARPAAPAIRPLANPAPAPKAPANDAPADDEGPEREKFAELVAPHREQALAWMVREGWLKEGAPLASLDISNIRKVLKRPAAFLRAVQQAAAAAGVAS